jgi:hypothetical protein
LLPSSRCKRLSPGAISGNASVDFVSKGVGRNRIQKHIAQLNRIDIPCANATPKIKSRHCLPFMHAGIPQDKLSQAKPIRCIQHGQSRPNAHIQQHG